LQDREGKQKMIQSMTGFGRGTIEKQGREMMAEIKTLNHRYLDIYIKLPRCISFLEDGIRKIVQQHLIRGRVELTIGYLNKQKDAVSIKVNEPLLTAYISSFEKLDREFNIKNDITISSLIGISDLFIVDEIQEDEICLKSMAKDLIEETLYAVKQMRAQEGERLKQDLLERIKKIELMLNQIEERAPYVVYEYQQKLGERLQELLQSSDLDENRFNMEVATFADRSNITEEIVRLKSHLGQFVDTMDTEGSIGRKLDFLVQEMNREANTISSKANDVTIVKLVVDMKSEIEKIREQVQNIE
jgi:uncharacterized protein (TIGR00255 family)